MRNDKVHAIIIRVGTSIRAEEKVIGNLEVMELKSHILNKSSTRALKFIRLMAVGGRSVEGTGRKNMRWVLKSFVNERDVEDASAS